MMAWHLNSDPEVCSNNFVLVGVVVAAAATTHQGMDHVQSHSYDLETRTGPNAVLLVFRPANVSVYKEAPHGSTVDLMAAQMSRHLVSVS